MQRTQRLALLVCLEALWHGVLGAAVGVAAGLAAAGMLTDGLHPASYTTAAASLAAGMLTPSPRASRPPSWSAGSRPRSSSPQTKKVFQKVSRPPCAPRRARKGLRRWTRADMRRHGGACTAART